MRQAPIKFELWSPPLDAPPRSRLYSLEPIGIGGPDVESLSSYINRLAQAHCVTVSALLKHELVPRAGKKEATDENSLPARWLPRGVGTRLARMISGLGLTAERWVGTLQALTGRRDLRFLTLLDWRGVLPNRKLFSPVIRWCPACFDDRLEAGQTIYHPLLWKLDPITACLPHRRRLLDRCDHCRKQAEEFSGSSRPGYCSRCGHWLGVDSRADLPPEDQLTEDQWEWQNWVIKNLGELLQTAPRLDRPPPVETIARSITYYLAQQSDAGLADLSKALGSKPDRLCMWSRGESRMQIDLMLKFCFHCGISLAQFLTEPPPSAHAQPDSTSQKTIVQEAAKERWGPKGVNREELCRVMSSALEHEVPPPSLRAISKRVGLASRTLRYYEPDLFRKIVERGADYRAHLRDRVRQVLEESIEREPPPSLKSLFGQSDLKISMAQHHFPDLCRQVTARHRDYRQQLVSDLKRALEQSLLEDDPPPTLDFVAARLGRCSNGIRHHFPDLCRRITERNLKYQNDCFLKRRQSVIEEIRETARQLDAQGIFPSVNQVSGNLPRPRNIGSNEKIVAELRKVRKELGWE